MKDILLLSGLILLVTVCAIFTILFTTISMALKQASFFKGKISTIVALCVSLLSVIGMLRFLGLANGESSRSGRNFDVILLPYAALGIAVLLLLLIAFLLKIFRKPKAEKYHNEFYRGKERQYPFASTREHVKKPDEKDRIRK